MTDDRETIKADLLYLPTLDDEAQFVAFLCQLMEQDEHRATAKIVYCRLSGQTVEEFDQRCASCEKLLSQMYPELNTSAR